MRAYMRNNKIANKPSAFDDFLTLCTHFGFVQCSNKAQALANLQVKDWMLPEETIYTTKLYKKLSQMKGTPQQCGSNPDEWRAITVLNAFMPAALHIIANCPSNKLDYCRSTLSVFHYRLLPVEAGQALISNKFYNPVNQTHDTWLVSRMYFLWSAYFTGDRESILVDMLRVFVAVYVAAYVSKELSIKIFSYALHIIKVTPVGDLNFNRAMLHTVSDILVPDGDGTFSANNLPARTLAQLSIKGTRYPTYKKLNSLDNWSLKEIFNYGWNLHEFAEEGITEYQEIFVKEEYPRHDKSSVRKCCDHCRYMFEMDMAFVSGTLAAYERVLRVSNGSSTEKERSIAREYEEKFRTINSRLSEKTAEHQETIHSLDKAEKRVKELEELVREKDEQLKLSGYNKYQKRAEELEHTVNSLNTRLSGAQNRIATLETRANEEAQLRARVKQLEQDCILYKEMLSVEVEEGIDERCLTYEEIDQLKTIRAHMIFPDLKSLHKLTALMPASRITFNGADHRVSVDVPKNMDMYVFCTRIAGHSDWDTWKSRTKNYSDRRVYCPYTGLTAVCRFVLQQYAKLHK